MMLSQPEPSIFPNAAAMLDPLVMCCASKEQLFVVSKVCR